MVFALGKKMIAGYRMRRNRASTVGITYGLQEDCVGAERTGVKHKVVEKASKTSKACPKQFSDSVPSVSTEAGWKPLLSSMGTSSFAQYADSDYAAIRSLQKRLEHEKDVLDDLTATVQQLLSHRQSSS
eukprot:Gregarina_sp_Poly_1__2524@NODE_1683_length_3539_cov_192_490207_g1106_i0_p3_GENE_NODE_1683_length_3539_cov_192_490207_g1106_i0NODE_1683_length_3539_cov_192_490207_g1106_i0_p3_ORF_typecomplete_len129_score11_60DUF4675/PF15720_5/0_038_NODE_1683_length_3539_cov_192_490207_g1106_i026643050